jgi:hypothetical protein
LAASGSESGHPVPDDAEDRQRERAAQFIDDGAALAGGFAGLAATGIAGSVVGVAGGVLVTRIARSLASAVWERLLEPFQRRRASEAFDVGVGRAIQRMQGGEQPRRDGFLEADHEENAPAWELLEGAMIHAANAYQQRKVPYIGFLWSSLLFRSDLSPDYGHFLLNLADRLTYRQLQAIAFFAENAGSDDLARLQAEREQQGGWWFADGLGVELNEGGDVGLFGIKQASGAVTHPRGTMGSGGIESANLA